MTRISFLVVIDLNASRLSPTCLFWTRTVVTVRSLQLYNVDFVMKTFICKIILALSVQIRIARFAVLFQIYRASCVRVGSGWT